LSLNCLYIICKLICISIIKYYYYLTINYISSAPCPTAKHVQHVNLTASEAFGIFDDLTSDEIWKVISYLQTNAGFSLKEFENVTIISTYIHSIELIPPAKLDALAFLDTKNGPRTPPARYAKVVLYWYDSLFCE